MRVLCLIFVLYFCKGDCSLWAKGVVHYAINSKDYDVHSQDEIISTLNRLSSEVCIKFFNTPMNHSTNKLDKILYINNPDKRKTCQPESYDYSKSVVDMVIGYKCINAKDITRITVDMLKASIGLQDSAASSNSYDLTKMFQDLQHDPSKSNLCSPEDRNYINAHYHNECGSLASMPVPSRRTGESDEPTGVLSEATQEYYKDKIWPLGVVIYSVDFALHGSPEHFRIKYAMTTIEMVSCVVFQELAEYGVLQPKSSLFFNTTGEDEPDLGYKEGRQTLNLASLVHGAAGHIDHVLNNLMRALGVPMMSNRYDRDNYVTINWKNVKKGKEHLLERVPEAAWMQHIPYDFDSVTHAPANYLCANQIVASQTVVPIQDHLWQRTIGMGHKNQLSESDIETLKLLYGKECERRFLGRDKK